MFVTQDAISEQLAECCTAKLLAQIREGCVPVVYRQASLLGEHPSKTVYDFARYINLCFCWLWNKEVQRISKHKHET